ncbi:protein spt2-like isoform X2 [Vigna unguiculata]|uniref:protein spt2-like isoform X2 n=1 Tax=Vigna unguiculata TaxID=3917 RepID=UPI0010168D25|nr:protein spt2-like isoform X2 [Vigna unguiculata]
MRMDGGVEGNRNFWNHNVEDLPLAFPPFQNRLHFALINNYHNTHHCTTRHAPSIPFSFSSLHHSIPSLTSITSVFHSTIPIYAYVAYHLPPKFISTAMRGYDRDGYDDYEDDGLEEGDEYEEDGEEEYVEEEPRKPTKEEQDYLELRKKLKESIRKQMKKENSNSLLDSARKNKLPYDNYGSFFGPSQPVIAQRVIQESKSLLENQHLSSRLSNSSDINKSSNKVSNGVLNSSVRHNIRPKVSEKQAKAQKLKVTRDYSFLLSDDVELPAPKKETPSHKTLVHNSERSGQVTGKSVSGGKIVRGSDENRKHVSGPGHLAPKSGSNYKISSINRNSKASVDSRKQLSSNSGNGLGRPLKMPVSTIGNKSLAPDMKNPVNGVHKALSSKLHSASGAQKPLSSKLHSVNGVQKPLSSKLHSVLPKQSVEQRNSLREQNKPKMISKQPVASTKVQINKPLKQIPKQSNLQDQRPKNKVRKRFDDETEDEMDVSRMIRSMFNYNPNKFVDEDDDADMEVGFDEIMKEEKRSAKIAREEDEEQLRLIQEEEERERRRLLAKRRKLGH